MDAPGCRPPTVPGRLTAVPEHVTLEHPHGQGLASHNELARGCGRKRQHNGANHEDQPS